MTFKDVSSYVELRIMRLYSQVFRFFPSYRACVAFAVINSVVRPSDVCILLKENVLPKFNRAHN